MGKILKFFSFFFNLNRGRRWSFDAQHAKPASKSTTIKAPWINLHRVTKTRWPKLIKKTFLKLQVHNRKQKISPITDKTIKTNKEKCSLRQKKFRTRNRTAELCWTMKGCSFYMACDDVKFFWFSLSFSAMICGWEAWRTSLSAEFVNWNGEQWRKTFFGIIYLLKQE